MLETLAPAIRREYRIDQHTTVVSYEHQPTIPARGQIIFLHGLEGSADAGYIRSFTVAALQCGFAAHRMNLRTCGKTEALCRTMYHSGLTSDTVHVIKQIRGRTKSPVFLVGFSLGGNVALKLTGELGRNDLLAGTVAVSPPIDLAACVKAIDRPSNTVYARRFLERLRSRIRRKIALSPGSYSAEFLDAVQSIWEFDNRFTAPLFGFGRASNYYATQSAINYASQIRTPTLVIAAQDDPLVPFEIFTHQAIEQNEAIELLAPKYGGHIGFLSRRPPRFWVDLNAMNWIERVADEYERT